MAELLIREAGPADAALIVALVRELAAYENLLEHARMSEADVLRDGFGPEPRFAGLIAEVGGEAAGLALYYFTYSTFAGRPALYLEDIFVRESWRGRGVGTALIGRLAAQALERGCTRLDLSVLHWNPARAFYHRLGFRQLADWQPHSLEGEGLRRLARNHP